jgi:uncharacterized protein (TIGR03086 family)
MSASVSRQVEKSRSCEPGDYYHTDMPDATSSLEQPVQAFEQLIAALRADQWAAPTPCTEWNVRNLVNHVVRGNRLFAAALRGEPPPPAEPADVLGDDPVAAYRAASNEMQEAFRQPGALDRVVNVPFGSVPGGVALHLRNTELLVHGWDLARATGQAANFPEAAAQQELEFSRRALSQIPPGRTPFGPPQPVADDAPAIDQLAGLLGRQV